jgi:acyl carrier protein
MGNLKEKEIIEQLINYVKTNFIIDGDISGSTDLLALGLDSLDIMNYLFFIQQKYGVQIADDQIAERGILIFTETAKHISESASGGQ